MNIDRELVDRIKEHFAGKKSVQLQGLLQSDDRERWSAEAITAAEEVLDERAAGRADEPAVEEPELGKLPAPPLLPYGIGFFFGVLSGIAAYQILDIRKRNYFAGDQSEMDLPVPFGFKTAWLAMSTRDTAHVAGALGLRDLREATWKEGIDAADQSSIYVTPPLGELTLAVGAKLFPPDMVRAFVKPLVERLSQVFGDGQYFCTNRVTERHVWARAIKGRLLRGFGYSGESGLTLWNEGSPTKEESDLRFEFVNGPSCEIGQSDPIANRNLAGPIEESVMELASLWSIDPNSLDAHYKEQTLGILGSLEGGPSLREGLAQQNPSRSEGPP